ncbi:hypothetical protein Lsan_3519 [Legionella santicrucis]|uniref:Uncharacterized protein n=1 Tax=Legionella santicrucis TaxID=45074 RepID=A0A0W0YAV1_9GAMM|nr:hypothetical protein [Legionella santicrucis]KTD53855.1 hypothetical protein Lsan_3519 [Legionella santicrucis]
MFMKLGMKPKKSSTNFKKQKFIANSLDGMQNRGISSYAFHPFNIEWSKPEKQRIAKEMTINTIISTPHPSRANTTQPLFPPGKKQHPSVVYAMGSTYGMPCAVDKIFAVCAEHYLLMRTAIGITRNPSPQIYEACCIIAGELGKELEKLEPKTLATIFEIGSNVAESRSKDVLENQRLLIEILKNNQQVPPQKLLRVLEVVLSPLGMLANAYGEKFCKIAKAKEQGKDVRELEKFMEEIIMPSLKPFHVPYIKAQGSPYSHLQLQEYIHGAEISESELVTVNHFLECCEGKQDSIPEIPKLRSVKVLDPTGRTIQLHDHMNLPHFFDVSGTTGAVMQAAMGLLHKAGRSDLINTTEKTTQLGMVLAGCNFYKQGYHNYYEVLPALNWCNCHFWKENYVQLTPTELLHAVPDSLKECVNPSTPMASIIDDTLDLVTEHFDLHHELFIADLQAKARQMQESTLPTFSNTEPK